MKIEVGQKTNSFLKTYTGKTVGSAYVPALKKEAITSLFLLEQLIARSCSAIYRNIGQIPLHVLPSI
jgi:hypothetical protein